MTDASQEFRRLASRSRRELEAVHRAGETPEIASLVGFEYRGFNHPILMRALGIRQFIKGFFSVGDQAFGFNTPARQSGLQGRWVAKPDEANPKRFAFYSVEPRHSSTSRPEAILLDYSRGDSGVPTSLIRDYVVRAEPGSDDLLLGKAYIGRVPVGLFVLERRRPFEPSAELAQHVSA
jgi:hypothetical protein